MQNNKQHNCRVGLKYPSNNGLTMAQSKFIFAGAAAVIEAGLMAIDLRKKVVPNFVKGGIVHCVGGEMILPRKTPERNTSSYLSSKKPALKTCQSQCEIGGSRSRVDWCGNCNQIID